MGKILLHEQVRERMIKKFDSIGKFCRCAGVDRKQVGKDLYCEKRGPGKDKERRLRFEDYSRLVKEISPLDDPERIPPQLRAKVHDAVEDRGGLHKFCRYSGFSESNTYAVTSGRRKRLTDKVKELCEYLEIDYKNK